MLSFYQPAQVLHLHTWWRSLAATCAGGVFPSAIGANSPCTGGGVTRCNLRWWSFSFHPLAHILCLRSSNLHCVVVVCGGGIYVYIFFFFIEQQRVVLPSASPCSLACLCMLPCLPLQAPLCASLHVLSCLPLRAPLACAIYVCNICFCKAEMQKFSKLHQEVLRVAVSMWTKVGLSGEIDLVILSAETQSSQQM